MKPFYTYILQCADRSYYTGHTDDLEKRVAQHQTGAIRGYTYERRPVELMWVQEFTTRYEALTAEIKIKNWSRAKKEALIAKDWDRLKLYSRPPTERFGLADARHSPSTSLGRNGDGESETEYCTYMLRCADTSYYVGHTDDLELALGQHRAGTRDEYTAKRLPIELAWSAPFSDRDSAFAAERRLKGWSRSKREALVAGDAALAAQLVAKAPMARVSGKAAAASGVTVPREEQPVIVLVRPQLGENIGKAARAMLNFGLTEIRLVDPRDGWPNPSAGPAAAGANVVLEHAQVFDTLAEAVADCAHVYATTVRKRGVTKPVFTPEQAAQAIHKGPGRSALVFGPERSGLDSDDVALARAIITVPINPEFASLNLAQAVILCAYEWSKGTGLSQPTAEDILPPAPQEELEGMIVQLEQMLEPRGYFKPTIREDVTRRTLRTLLTKPGWSHLEVRTMRGVLRTLLRKPEEG
jgi:tRNA/rRNA methyltransferase